MIYILEDDDNIRKLIVYTLQSHGFKCMDFSKPSQMWSALENHTPDLILLDIILPKEDGMSILKKLRENAKYKSILVIIITAKDTEDDMVKGLDSGADDYITKPFGMMNLISRINALLRRQENYTRRPKIIESGPFVIDISRHTVFLDTVELSLTLKEFDLLAVLIKNKGRVMSREELLNSVWNIDAEIESRTVDVHIRTLRQKLGRYENIIETIRGVGYVIN